MHRPTVVFRAELLSGAAVVTLLAAGFLVATQNRDSSSAVLLMGESMTYEMLSLLRSLATQPSRNIAATVQPMADELLRTGYIVNEEGSGWSATVEGCRVIESARASPLFFSPTSKHRHLFKKPA
jgi:hypothetical protein